MDFGAAHVFEVAHVGDGWPGRGVRLRHKRRPVPKELKTVVMPFSLSRLGDGWGWGF